jgi:DNA-binding beta-propeller fold protein YncE
VSIGPADLIAVADGTGGGVHILDLDSREHCVVSGFGDQRFAIPLGVAWAGTRLFVTDAKRAEVVELDAQGGFRGRFGQDVLVRPVGIAHVAERNQLCVVDGGDHALKLFDLDGTFIGTIGHRGTGPGEFNFPTHVCCTGDRLLVSDTGNFRVQLLDLDGKCLRTIGRKGDGAGDFSLPKGVAVDSEGHIYVVDAQFENVQVFQEAGHLLMAFGEEGDAPGRFSLPAGLAIDNKDRIWVADSGNHRLQVFAYIMRTSS